MSLAGSGVCCGNPPFFLIWNVKAGVYLMICIACRAMCFCPCDGCRPISTECASHALKYITADRRNAKPIFFPYGNYRCKLLNCGVCYSNNSTCPLLFDIKPYQSLKLIFLFSVAHDTQTKILYHRGVMSIQGCFDFG